MKKLLLSAAAIAFLFTACKKKDDNGTGNGLGKNQWKVNGTTFNALTAAAVQGGAGTLIASGTNGGTEVGSFTATFAGGAFPGTGGQFKIVDVADATDEVSIMVGTNNTSGSSAKAWGSTASTTATATVSVDNGKVTISVPEITVTSASATPSSTTFSGNITQY